MTRGKSIGGVFYCRTCEAVTKCRTIDSRLPAKAAVPVHGLIHARSRRRWCMKCGGRFTTLEVSVDDLRDITVAVQGLRKLAVNIGELRARIDGCVLAPPKERETGTGWAQFFKPGVVRPAGAKRRRRR